MDLKSLEGRNHALFIIIYSLVFSPGTWTDYGGMTLVAASLLDKDISVINERIQSKILKEIKSMLLIININCIFHTICF